MTEQRPDPTGRDERDNRTVERLRPLGETIFATMSRLAADTGAINLGQGYPDWDGPWPVLREAAAQILGGNNQYAPGRGDERLRRAICDDRRRRLGQDWDPGTECLVTVGATEAIAATMLGLVEPGARVVLVEPYYDAYRAAAMLAGADIDSVPLVRADGRWRLDTDALARAVTDRTALIVLNSPHNPTGALLDEDELTAVAELAVRHDCLVLSDEVYEHLLYDGRKHLSISQMPGMRRRSIVVSSTAKTFNVTGWKTGWALAAPEVLKGVATAKQFLSYVGAAPLQPAVALALNEHGDWVSGLVETLEGNRDYLTGELKGLGLDVVPAEGGYFVVADVRPLGLGNAMGTCLALPEAAGVAAIPVTAFVDDPEDPRWRDLVRFGFCKRREVLEEGIGRIREYLARGNAVEETGE